MAWLLVLTALAASSIGSSFIYLQDEIQTDPAYIEFNLSKIAAGDGWDLAAARKANYTDEEIVSGIMKKNRAEFNRRWYRILEIVGSLYIVSLLGVLAVMLRKEAKL